MKSELTLERTANENLSNKHLQSESKLREEVTSTERKLQEATLQIADLETKLGKSHIQMAESSRQSAKDRTRLELFERVRKEEFVRQAEVESKITQDLPRDIASSFSIEKLSDNLELLESQQNLKEELSRSEKQASDYKYKLECQSIKFIHSTGMERVN